MTAGDVCGVTPATAVAGESAAIEFGRSYRLGGHHRLSVPVLVAHKAAATGCAPNLNARRPEWERTPARLPGPARKQWSGSGRVVQPAMAAGAQLEGTPFGATPQRIVRAALVVAAAATFVPGMAWADSWPPAP